MTQVLDDGRVVVVNGSSLSFYTGNGALERSIGQSGAGSVVVQADGRIIVAGGSTVGRYCP